MNENKLHQGLILFVYAVLLLLLLYWLPAFSIAGFTFKKIDLLSDIRPEQEIKPLIAVDTIEIEAPVHIDKLPCPVGVTCIEDFSEEGDAMSSFYTALRKASKQRVRIGFFGDSFIEGDILTGSLRDTLQQIFGGSGPGLVPMVSEVAKFRTTIQQTFENWGNETITAQYEKEPNFGPAGFSATPLNNNHAEFKPGKKLLSLEPAEIFLQASAPRLLEVTFNDSIRQTIEISAYETLQRLTISKARSQSIRLSVSQPDSLDVYGVSFEQGNGLFVDNLALRGNSGMALTRISSTVLQAFSKEHPYHLIVLQYGLNVVSEKDSSDYGYYVFGMTRVIEYLKKSIPNASILLISVSDRSINDNGNYHTMPSVLNMRNAQRRIAKKTGIAFWDMFTAMGGENSMVELVNRQPPLAGKDYTHLNYRGGSFMASKLAKALLFEQTRYEKATHPN